MQIEAETTEERYVREKLLARFGVVLRKIEESREPRIRSADFEMLHQNHRIAVAEVKNMERTPRTIENGFQQDGVFLTRDDNSPARVGDIIHRAHKQLSCYPDDLPKILVIVNDETAADVRDLKEAYEGFLLYGNEEVGFVRNELSSPIANGRIKHEKGHIDLYIWFDRHYGVAQEVVEFWPGQQPVTKLKSEAPYFRCTSQRGLELLNNHFGLAKAQRGLGEPEPA